MNNALNIRGFFEGLLAIMAATVFTCTGCNNGGGGSNSTAGTSTGTTTGTSTGSAVRLTGTITGSMNAGLFKSSKAAALTVDEVWAIPIAKMQGANIDSVNVMLRKTSTLTTNGDFTFDLEKTITLSDILAKIPTMDTGDMPADSVFDVDWMLVQMSGAEPVSVIALQGDTTYDSLLSIPVSAFTPGSMNVGVVDPASGVATLTVSSLSGDVTMSSASLAALARADNIMATIKDVIRNCDITANKCYSGRQSFVFTGSYGNLTAGTYDTAGSYSGYQLYFKLTDYFDKTDFDGICPASGPATVEYQLTPPGPISVGSVTYYSLSSGTSNTVTLNDLNGGAYTECFKDGVSLYLRKDNSPTSSSWDLQFITGDNMLISATPPGDWVLSRKGSGDPGFTDLARFEFSLANPVDASGFPIVFVPAIRFDTDGSSGITMLHLKWYQNDGAGTFVEVTDTAMLDSLMGGFEVSMDDFSGTTIDSTRRSAQLNNISFGTASIDVTDLDGKGKFYYNYSLEDKYSLEYIGVDYMFGGQSFRFAWSKYMMM
jgi:hypothetical protein